MMKGFFTQKKVRKRSAVEAEPCDACGLFKGCISPQMEHSGDGRRGILVLAEGPGREEDEDGTQLIGEAGQLLEEKMWQLADIDLHGDCFKLNAVNCRPPKNRKPTPREIECCRHFMVEATIRDLNPKYIILAGGAAVESMYKEMFSDCSIGRWRGGLIPDTRYGAWVMPILHPSYYMRNKTDANITSVFNRDMRRVGGNIRRKSRRPEGRNFGDNVTLGIDYQQVMEKLDELLRQRKTRIYIDYEASSLKPYGPEQRIWTISFSYSSDHAFTFPYSYPHWDSHEWGDIRDMWRKVLQAKRILKVAHGVKFEDTWSRVIFDVPYVEGWEWCTMTTAHNEDVRRGNAGLKYLLFKMFGQMPYEGDVKKFMKPKPPLKVNTLDRVPLPKLLGYNGIDTAGGMAVYDVQKRRVRGKFKEANLLTFDGSLALADAQIHGVNIDEIYYAEQRQTLTEKIDEIENLLLNGDVAQKFRQRTRKMLKIKNKDFAANDLRIIFFDILGITPTKLTGKAKQPAIDKEVLGDIDHDFARQIIERRKLVKMRDTYIASLIREVEQDGRIHPFYDLTTTRTLRSSSSDPNFQNIPNREEEDRRLIRCGIYPSPGRRIGAVDYGSIEVRILACCTRDPVLIAYILDETTDMHRDEAKKIFVLSEDWIEKKFLKNLRSWIKNQWVFPQFYGSYYVTCAKAIWDLCFGLEVRTGFTVYDHLVEEGVIDRNPRRKTKIMRGNKKVVVTRQYADWEQHIKDLEMDFWDKYHVSREWQDAQTSFYQQHGYVELLTGHRRAEILNRNKIYNTPVQGTAFQCLLWSYKTLNGYARREWETKLFGQIHDEILFDIEPRETIQVLKKTEQVMCHDIRERYDWLIVPLVIEPELTPVDGAWYYKKEVNLAELTRTSRKGSNSGRSVPRRRTDRSRRLRRRGDANIN